MNMPRVVISQFCDDIRSEVGNKYSLIGCYMSQLLVDEFPIALPKLCVQVRVITPKDKPISKLTVRAVMLDKIIATVTPDINNDTSQHLPEELSFTESSVMMIFSPLSITEPGSLRIEAEVDGEVLQGGILLLRKRPPTTEAIN